MTFRTFCATPQGCTLILTVPEHQPVSCQDIDTLLLGKLPEVLTEEQKLNRIHNLLRQLAEAGRIHNAGGRRWPKWVLGSQPASNQSSINENHMNLR